MLQAYQQIHGSLLTKGVSFSLIIASVPLLFLLVTISSFLLSPEIIELVDSTLYGFLPQEQRVELVAGVRRYAGREGSLTVLTGFVFLLAVHNAFFDLNRMIATGLGIRRGVGRSRLAALIAQVAFVGLLYAATILSGAARWISRQIALSPAAFNIAALAVSTLIISLVLLLMYRWVAGGGLRLRPAFLVSLLAAILWQALLAAAGMIVRFATSRFVAYGVLASAVLFLIFMRLVAEIMLFGALLLRTSVARRGALKQLASPPEGEGGQSVGPD